MSRVTEQGYKITDTLDEAVNKIDEVVSREIGWATDDVEDIDVAWVMLQDYINKARAI